MSMFPFLNRETETCEILTTRYAGARCLLYPKHLSVIIGVFRPLLEKGKVIPWQSKRIRLHTHARPCAYAGKHTAENQRIAVYGVFEREERTDDV